MKGEYVVIENYGQAVEPSVLTDAMLDATIAHFFGRYQDAHQPVEPEMPTERTWKTYTITGFDGMSSGSLSGWLHFRLPDKEQVPCGNTGTYGCEHWLNEGWMGGNRVLCDTCLKKESHSCDC